MSTRIARLALASTLPLVAPAAARTQQATDAAKPFLTGPCAVSGTFVNLDDLVAEPEQPATVAAIGDMPVPPAELRTKRDELKLVAAFVVDTSGTVRPATTTIMSSNDADLSRWACDVVPRMHFAAARHHGHAVASQVVMPFAFRSPVVSREPASSVPRVYLETEVEKKATIDHRVFPRYPDDLKRQGIDGRVVATFVIDTTGLADMSTFRVLHASDARFQEAVRRAVGAMTFHPAEIAGRKVKQVVEEPFDFWIERD